MKVQLFLWVNHYDKFYSASEWFCLFVPQCMRELQSSSLE